MRRLLILCLLCLPSSAWGAIAHNGTCSASTTSCTFSATATSSLKIIFAYRSGSTTAPALPSGWTTVTTVVTSASGTTGAVRVGCNVSSSSGDTGSGTWTNATVVIGESYSGTNAQTTTNCNASGIGAFATNQAKASTTLNYPAITLQAGNTSSWVVGLAGDSIQAPCNPSGMTNIATVGTGPGGSVGDTNAGTNTWSSTNCTVSSGTWLSAVLEVLAPAGTPALVHYKGGTTTRASPDSVVSSGGVFHLYLPFNSLSGNAIFVACTYGSTSTSVSLADNIGNTYTKATTATDATNGQALALWYSFKTTSGVNDIHFTNSTGGAIGYVQCHYAEFDNAGGALDGTAVSANPSSTSVAAGSITAALAGSLFFQAAFNSGNAAYSAATVGTSFTWGDLQDLEGFATQWQVKAASGALNPTFTQTGSSAVVTSALAVKALNVGTALPAGVNILKESDINTTNETSASVSFTFPTSQGNTIVATETAGCGSSILCYNLTAVTDSASNIYSFSCLLNGTSSLGSTANIFVAPNITPASTNKLTYTLTLNGDSTGHGATFKVYELTGADTTTPQDTSFGSSGCLTSSGTNASGNVATSSGTPGATNEVGILVGGQAFNSATGWASPSGMLFTGCYFTGILNPSHCDENNPYGVYYNGGSVSTITPTYTHDTSDSAGSGEWETAMIFLKAPSGGAVVRHRIVVVSQ